jgi:hypothetical protein
VGTIVESDFLHGEISGLGSSDEYIGERVIQAVKMGFTGATGKLVESQGNGCGGAI